MKKRKIAVVLGGTEPHIHLIVKLKERGYYTILIDYLDNPPAKSFANEHIKESTLDVESVYRICKEVGAELIISACIDHANMTACTVGERLGLSVPYSSDTALKVTRKDIMKKVFFDNSINTSDYFVVSKENLENISISFPAVVKPVDCNSSKGVFKVNNYKEYKEKMLNAINLSRVEKGIVEDYVEGTEIQVDCVVVNKFAYVLMTRDKRKFENTGAELQVTGFTVPGEICECARKELNIIAQKITDAFDINNTPFFFQAIKSDKGIFVLEFAPRIAGGTTYDLIQKYCGFDILDAMICSFRGIKIDVAIQKTDTIFMCDFLYMKPGIYDHIEGIQEKLATTEINYYYEFVVKGRKIDSSHNSGNRIAAIVVEADNYIKASEKLNNAKKTLRVIDIKGNDLTYRKESQE